MRSESTHRIDDEAGAKPRIVNLNQIFDQIVDFRGRRSLVEEPIIARGGGAQPSSGFFPAKSCVGKLPASQTMTASFYGH